MEISRGKWHKEILKLLFFTRPRINQQLNIIMERKKERTKVSARDLQFRNIY